MFVNAIFSAPLKGGATEVIIDCKFGLPRVDDTLVIDGHDFNVSAVKFKTSTSVPKDETVNGDYYMANAVDILLDAVDK